MPRRTPTAGRRRPSIEPLEGRALRAALMVTNTLDSGAGSLRQAILDADAAAGGSTIGFAIPGPGVRTISPASDLPSFNQPVTIDGTTEPGYAGTPLVAIDGGDNVAQGLTFVNGSDGSIARGLAVDRFRLAGFDVEGPRVTIEANDVGVDPTGAAGSGNESGIDLTDALGTDASPGTLISGNVVGENQYGIYLEPGINASIAGNFIGTDARGTAGLGNVVDGIYATSGTAGTTVSNNTIADNGQEAIQDLSTGGLTLSGNTLANNGDLLANLAVATSTGSVATTAGRTITATYTLTNDGPAVATAAQLVVTARGSEFSFGPPGMATGGFVASPVIRITGVTSTSGTVVATFPGVLETANLGDLAPGASASITVTALAIGSGDDGLIVSGTSQSPSATEAAATVRTPVIATGTADLAVAASPPTIPARAGRPETFTFIVTNRDPSSNADALFALQFTTPAGTATSGVMVSQGRAISLSLPAGSFPDGYGGDLGTLAPGASATITATIIPPAGGIVSASAYAYSAYDADPAPADNLAFAAALAVDPPSFVGATLLPTAGAISAVAVYFDAPLDPSSAQKPGNYALTTDGGRARIALRSATLDASTNTVTLRLARPLSRPGAAVRLTVAGPGSAGLEGTDHSALLNPGITLTLPRA